MDEVPNEGSKQGLWSIFCATCPFATQESSSNLLPHPTHVSVAGQSGARHTVYVRGIIRISYGAGWRQGGGGGGGGRQTGERGRGGGAV